MKKGKAAVLRRWGDRDLTSPSPVHCCGSAAIALYRRLAVMTWPAQALQIAFRIGSPMCFGSDVVDCLRLGYPSFTQALLAQMLIPAQNHQPQPVPFGTVATFVSTLALLMVLPPCIAVFFAVSAAVCGCLCAASLATGAWYTWWHRFPQ